MNCKVGRISKIISATRPNISIIRPVLFPIGVTKTTGETFTLIKILFDSVLNNYNDTFKTTTNKMNNKSRRTESSCHHVTVRV